MCAAAPIGSSGATIAAISVAFPAYIDEERGIGREIQAVTRCAAAISARLAGRTVPTVAGPPPARKPRGRIA